MNGENQLKAGGNGMKKSIQPLLVWIVIMFLITFTCLLTYLVAQQSLRLGANEKPANLAKETAIQLANGKSPKQAVSGNKVNLAKSPGVFVIVYDNQKHLQATNAKMNGSAPGYPKSVLDHVSKGCQDDRVTWQPESGMRFATVAIKSSNGYIVAGQSLTETESLISKIGRLVMLGWLGGVIFTTATYGIVYFGLKKLARMGIG